MKYIKTYENIVNQGVKRLVEHIESTLNNFSKVDLMYQNGNEIKFVYFYKGKGIYQMTHLFKIILLDYSYGDLDKYFEFRLHKQFELFIKVKFSLIYEPILFINEIMKKHSQQNMIAFSDIDKIISEISTDDIKTYIDSKKYNL